MVLSTCPVYSAMLQKMKNSPGVLRPLPSNNREVVTHFYPYTLWKYINEDALLGYLLFTKYFPSSLYVFFTLSLQHVKEVL